MKTWLILDVSNMAHRAMYSIAKRFPDDDAGILYGIFRGVLALQEQFDTRHTAWAFDSSHSLRRELCPTYKQATLEKRGDPNWLEALTSLDVQVDQLRRHYLPRLGFKNVFGADGYEADDMIASIVRGLPAGGEAVIISSDHDLYQLLSPGVMLYKPVSKKVYTDKSFRGEFGLHPSRWYEVKCLAGCKSDGVPGVPGVGETTAVKYLTGKLPSHYQAYKNIRANAHRFRGNERLVRLPFTGCPACTLREDNVTRDSWRAVLEALEMDDLLRGAV